MKQINEELDTRIKIEKIEAQKFKNQKQRELKIPGITLIKYPLLNKK